MSFEIPILLVTWRRPDTTRELIKALRAVKPRYIYVSSDGARNADELNLVQATRDIIDREIDWDCQVKKRFSELNLGCEKGYGGAITWFFDHVEQGIILQDDCIPHPDFFVFCETLLDRYRYDFRVWHISGNNFQDGQWRGSGDYYFSYYPHDWGWATWRSRWANYSHSRMIWNEVRIEKDFLQSAISDSVERSYWKEIWERLFSTGEPDSCSYHWILVCLANQGLAILPNRNLVYNIGFGADATHTFRSVSQGSTDDGLVINNHPVLIYQDKKADAYTFKSHFGGDQYRRSRSLVWSCFIRVKLLFARPLYYPVKLFRLLRRALS